jgi:hypothetical protein
VRASRGRDIIRDAAWALAFVLVLSLGVCEFVPAETCAPASCVESCCTCVRSAAGRKAASSRRTALPQTTARVITATPLPALSAVHASASSFAPKPRSGFDRYSSWARAPSSTGSRLVLL